MNKQNPACSTRPKSVWIWAQLKVGIFEALYCVLASLCFCTVCSLAQSFAPSLHSRLAIESAHFCTHTAGALNGTFLLLITAGP